MSDLAELAEFLLARISEDKAVALAASAPGWTSYSNGTVLAGRNEHGFVLDVADAKDTDRHHNQSGERVSKADATHIARWEPGRVLVDCEAKRKIVEEAARTEPEGFGDYSEGHRNGEYETAQTVLRLLALPYADHRDYQQEWKL